VAARTSRGVKAVGMILLLLFVTVLVQNYLRARHAFSQAQSVCDSIHVGDDAKASLNAMERTDGRVQSDEKSASVRFLGFGAQWVGCSIEYSNGKVTQAKAWDYD
jgi:hypothetical protein